VWLKEVIKSLLEKALRKRGFFMLKYPKRGKPMLVIVKTTGSFMLCPYDGGATPLIEANTPTLCSLTPFIEYRVKTGQLSVLAENVSERANQEALDAAESIEEYLKSLEPKTPTPPTKTKKST
jgi:hypothetical protein